MTNMVTLDWDYFSEKTALSFMVDIRRRYRDITKI